LSLIVLRTRGISGPFCGLLMQAESTGLLYNPIDRHHSALRRSRRQQARQSTPVAMIPNIKHAIREMKNSGIIIAGAEASAETTIWDADLKGPLALVIGSEGHGLRRTVKEECDMLVNLPMKGRVNSLNASVATGVVIFEIMRQRTSN